jgi:N-acetylmuramoyl-L-alanine amidase
MIGLALALQLAATSPAVAPGVLSVRSGPNSADIPTFQFDGISSVPVRSLAPVLPARDSVTAGGRHVLRIAELSLELADGVPYARANGTVYPLAVAPRDRDGLFLVPYEVFSELLPRLSPARWVYDPARRELTLVGKGESPPLVAVSSPVGPRAPTTRPGGKGRKRRVVVDAGHGGPDYGMRGPIGTHWQIHEKDITLAVAKKLAAALRARGVDVIMTRTTDTLIALSDRGRIANEQHGDVFVSVHVNAAPLDWKKPGDTKGYETYFLAEAKTEDARRVERMENESIHFETGAASKQGDPINFIINDMAQNEHLRESSELASIVQERLGEASSGPSRGVFQAGFRVLVTAYMPAVLVEIGFGTNKEEAKLLDNSSYQKRIAASIADATIEYLNHYEQRVSGTPKPAVKGKGDAPSGTKLPPRP